MVAHDDGRTVAIYPRYGGPPVLIDGSKRFWWWHLIRWYIPYQLKWNDSEPELYDERGSRIK